VRPLLRCLALGALLFAGERYLLRDASSAPDLAGDEALLAGEARRLGLDRDDPVVRGRLVRNLRLAADDQRPAELLYREALALGMDRSDWIVERRLAERMQARLRAVGVEQPVSEEALRAFYERHLDAWTRPAAWRISHVFFSRARRGAAAGPDAQSLLAALRAEQAGPDGASARGDAFLLGSDLPARSEAELARELGPHFAAAVAALAPGAWSEPIASSYGVHLVWVREQVPPRPMPLDSVRGRVEDALRAERGDAALRAALQQLRR